MGPVYQVADANGNTRIYLPRECTTFTFAGHHRYRVGDGVALDELYFTTIDVIGPMAALTCPSGTATFSVTPVGIGPFTYQWQIETAPGVWQTLGNDPFPLPCGGGAFAFATPINSPTVQIGVHPCPGVSSYQIRCMVSNACGIVTSNPAALTIGARIVSANPPAAAQNGGVPFRDVLQNTDASLNPQGIGVVGTPNEGTITYANISVTFCEAPVPAPAAANITVSCTGGTCPSVTDVSGSGPGPYILTFSGSIPRLQCTTITFAGTAAGQKLQYQFLPGDVNVNGTTTGQDVIALVAAINNGTANTSLARYDINRNGMVTGQDVVRLVQLLNGANATQAFNAATVAPCP